MELPLSTIIVALLVLSVLVILIIFLTRGSSQFASTAFSCENKGGECIAANLCQYEKTSYTCLKSTSNEKLVCCINPLRGD